MAGSREAKRSMQTRAAIADQLEMKHMEQTESKTNSRDRDEGDLWDSLNQKAGVARWTAMFSKHSRNELSVPPVGSRWQVLIPLWLECCSNVTRHQDFDVAACIPLHELRQGLCLAKDCGAGT